MAKVPKIVPISDLRQDAAAVLARSSGPSPAATARSKRARAPVLIPSFERPTSSSTRPRACESGSHPRPVPSSSMRSSTSVATIPARQLGSASGQNVGCVA